MARDRVGNVRRSRKERKKCDSREKVPIIRISPTNLFEITVELTQ